ncbi:uncharacterized protein LOC110224633 [Arabidopsis lyrata subsp. lyrata]|uniref:uncharacterized protein LOC110224633 n=1 Tax=Arabidopsis lyrata subsp. lyrata TaxID=81972 RepID=UPI000A29BD92|nr:uncharacterized protein LOC110224633 [Arabidopsis lyrata subsp. lyrata]|eukprot:XP_020866665.1 uncharacterized protein LOC110224633 [Arabidopsis lyrata subsp. lyrata]
MNISRDSYTANVTIFNYLKKEDIEGLWELGWIWYEDEILLSTVGAKVSKQSNVLKFVDCCMHKVTFVALPQHGKNSSSFQITVGQVGIEFHPPPQDLKLTTH